MATMVTFSLLVIEHPLNSEHDKRFCLVHEIEDRGWWLPGGGVDDGESAAEGGIREAREEAGVYSIAGDLRLLRVEQTESRFRWILHCRAATEALKTEADSESNGARWVTLQECAAIDRGEMQGIEHCWLRGVEPMKWFQYIAAGQPSYALSEFVQATSQKGAQDVGGRAVYRTSSDGRIAVIRKSSGLVAAIRNTSGSFRLPSTAVAPRASELSGILASPAVDALAFSIMAPRPDCICGMKMLQKADATATFVAVFGVKEHAQEEAAQRIASESDAAPNHEGLQWVAIGSLEDEFERDCVNRLHQLRVMPRSVLVHNMGHYPPLP